MVVTIAALLRGSERNVRGLFEAKLVIFYVELPAMGNIIPVKPEADLCLCPTSADSSVGSSERLLLIADQSSERRVGEVGLIGSAHFYFEPCELVIAFDSDEVDAPRGGVRWVIGAQPLPCGPSDAKC